MRSVDDAIGFLAQDPIACNRHELLKPPGQLPDLILLSSSLSLHYFTKIECTAIYYRWIEDKLKFLSYLKPDNHRLLNRLELIIL